MLTSSYVWFVKKAKLIFTSRYVWFGLAIALVYVLTWFGFGLWYVAIADQTAGREFIFQEDLKVKSKIAGFKQKAHFSVSDSILQRLITHPDWLSIYRETSEQDDLATGIQVANEPIGPDWAKYYEAGLTAEGATHYSYLVDPPEFNVYASTREGSQLEEVRLTTYQQTRPNAGVSHPIDAKDTTERNRYFFLISPSHSLPAKSESKPGVSRKGIFASGMRPIGTLHESLNEALSSLDDSPRLLTRAMNGSYKYDRWDFLYFSAITITTVGYGDILPNSTRVRKRVMVEALLGIVLAGLFVSILFAGLSRDSHFPKPKGSTHSPPML